MLLYYYRCYMRYVPVEALKSTSTGIQESRTLSKQVDRFPASCRARSRNLSYSASASLLMLWLNAVNLSKFLRHTLARLSPFPIHG